MSNTIVLLCLFLALVSSTSAAAAPLNIARQLSKFPEFSTFNDLCNRTGVYTEIGGRRSLTILVVANDGIKDISGRSDDIIKRILSTHVMLDYFDVTKLRGLKKSIMVTNLLQSSGKADGQQGFINVTATAQNKIGFASAVPSSPVDVEISKGIMTQPYDLSIVQVSGIIYTPGLDGTFAAPPRKAVAPSTATAPPPPKENDTTASSPSSSPSSSTADAPAPTTSTPADTPTASAPAPAPADAPAADKGTADAAPPTKSSAVALFSGLFSGLVLTLVSSLALF